METVMRAASRLVLPLLAACCAQSVGQTSFWDDSMMFDMSEATNDTASVTLGLKFYSEVPGSVIAVRFYKGPHNDGTHVGHLWSATGTMLAEVVFAKESHSGWQRADFSAPVRIDANTVYIVSYAAPRGNYTITRHYSWPALTRPPLHVSDGSPGVFSYGMGAVFPENTWNEANYWVDVVFIPADLFPTHSISGQVTGSAATLTLWGPASATVAVGDAGTYTFSALPDGAYLVIPRQPGYVFTPSTTLVTIDGGSISRVDFTAFTTRAFAHRIVFLRWTPSHSRNISGYNVYRASQPGGPYIRLNTLPIRAMVYIDTTAIVGEIYFYVATAVADNGQESAYSDEATADLRIR
jgi:hypothetical protein